MKKLVLLFVLSLGMMTAVNAQVTFTVEMPTGVKMSFTQNGKSHNLPCCGQIIYYKNDSGANGVKTESRGIPDGYWHFPVYYHIHTDPNNPIDGSFILAGPQSTTFRDIINFLINTFF